MTSGLAVDVEVNVQGRGSYSTSTTASGRLGLLGSGARGTWLSTIQKKRDIHFYDRH